MGESGGCWCWMMLVEFLNGNIEWSGVESIGPGKSE